MRFAESLSFSLRTLESMPEENPTTQMSRSVLAKHVAARCDQRCIQVLATEHSADLPTAVAGRWNQLPVR
jgi:hypothetical protein